MKDLKDNLAQLIKSTIKTFKNFLEINKNYPNLKSGRKNQLKN